MEDVVFLKGKKVVLVPLDLKYLDTYLKWFNDPEIRRLLCTAYPISREQEKDLLEKMIKDMEAVHLSIIVKENGQLIGNISLMKINRIHHHAELGIAVGEKNYWNKGLGTEAMDLVLGYGFNTLNLHRIYLVVNAFNHRAISAYEKIGFKREGAFRDAIYIDGRYYDLLIMGILHSEWKNRTSQN
jgi:UDP-4-amino-4,6-dideoxy-N-acetyl-beta-L-altrosamine N-acetyltransferase